MKLKIHPAIIAFVAFVILVIGIVGIGFSSYVHYRNYAVGTENSLRAKLQDVENVYAQGTQTIMEIAKVPGMYKKDLIDIVKADIQGRYGPEGSQATFQWLKERNLPIDQSMYVAIQQEIRAFRARFEKIQREMINMRLLYENQIGYFWSGLWLGIAGYPKVDLTKFDIVTTDKARETMETKRDKGVNLP